MQLMPASIQSYSFYLASMVYALIYLLLFFTYLLPFTTIAQANGNVSVGTSLAATRNSNPWLSPKRDFAFGFQKLQDEDDVFLLSIWYDKIPDKTIVWYANQGNPVKEGSRVELTSNRGLVLTDPQNQEVWNSGGIADEVAYGFLNDTGNFVLVRSDSLWIWETFKNPTDTMLPTQIMEVDGVLYSRLSQTNFSRGRFQFRLLQDGNLVLNSRNIPTDFPYDAYYISGTRDASNASNSGFQVIFNQTGYMYVLKRSQERFDLTPGMIPTTTDFYHRATLNFDGVFTQYYHPKRFTGNPNWTAVWFKPENICVDILGDKGSGACGYNNVCSLGESGRPMCNCPQGYTLLDPSNEYGSCKSSFTLSCEEGGLGSAHDEYDLTVLSDTDWPTSDYEQLKPYDEEKCKNSCLQDCFCAVAIQRQDSCWKKKLPLSNGRKDARVNGKAFLKYRKGNVPPGPSPTLQCPISKPEKDQSNLIIVGSVFLGSSVFVNFVLVVAACLGFFSIYQKKIKKPQSINTALGNNLRCFTYKELVEATNEFREELGRGAFGIVYKGTVSVESKILVAVKKLDSLAQDSEKEFKTEVNVIGQIHHKNLVRLLGFCDEGQHRLLVYEYMSNGALANFIFREKKLSWDQRTQIALGIARGLTYLHEECDTTQIIHCDIKSQNILLDDYCNARISDFGLAKLLMINQSRTNTGIRGTKGYVAPEWFRNTPINAKVDVYSFGVLLLEIICCRRSVEDIEISGEEKAILIYWVWDCFAQGRLDALVEDDEEVLNDQDMLHKWIMVGIWCIQENPSLRPTMRSVSQMLEGVVQVDNPPCPFLLSVAITT